MLPAPAPMHIPDGFLSFPVSIVLWLAALLAIISALRKNNLMFDDRKLPLMGVLAAAIFAGQMLNFTVVGGTSGHLMGAALAAILIGPWPAVLVMTSVVSVQALVFQDGGLLALGANLFNMAVLGVFVSYTVHRLFQLMARGRTWGNTVGGFAAAWFSIEIAALAVGLQLAVSVTSPANIALPAMSAIHALIGIGEGIITVGALVFLTAARPDLLKQDSNHPRISRPVWVGGSILALALVAVSPFASVHPDGLEWVARTTGFHDLARPALYSLVPDYLMPGINNPILATILAGVVGVLLVAGVAVAVSRRQRTLP